MKAINKRYFTILFTCLAIVCSAVFFISAKTVAVSAELEGFSMVNGASVRFMEEGKSDGIRFETRLTPEKYDQLKVMETSKTGILIIPTEELGSNDLTVGLAGVKDAVTSQSWIFDEKENVYKSRACVIGIGENYYDTKLSVVGYAYSDSEQPDYTPYSALNNSRSMADVAKMAIGAYEVGSNEYYALLKYFAPRVVNGTTYYVGNDIYRLPNFGVNNPDYSTYTVKVDGTDADVISGNLIVLNRAGTWTIQSGDNTATFIVKYYELLNSTLSFETEEDEAKLMTNLLGVVDKSVVEYGGSEIAAPALGGTKVAKLTLANSWGNCRSYVDIMFGEVLPTGTLVSLKLYVASGPSAFGPYLQWYNLLSGVGTEYAYGYLSYGAWHSIDITLLNNAEGIRLNIWDSVGSSAYIDNFMVFDAAPIKLNNTTVGFENDADQYALIKNVKSVTAKTIVEYGGSEIAAPALGGTKGAKLTLANSSAGCRSYVDVMFGEVLPTGTLVSVKLFVASGSVANPYLQWYDLLSGVGTEHAYGYLSYGAWHSIDITLSKNSDGIRLNIWDSVGSFAYIDNFMAFDATPIKLNNTSIGFETDADQYTLVKNIKNVTAKTIVEYGGSEIAAPEPGETKASKLTLAYSEGSHSYVDIMFGEVLQTGAQISLQLYVVSGVAAKPYLQWYDLMSGVGTEHAYGYLTYGAWYNINVVLTKNSDGLRLKIWDSANSFAYLDNITVSGQIAG